MSIGGLNRLWLARTSVWGICIGAFSISGLACWYLLIPWCENVKLVGSTPCFAKILLTVGFSFQIMTAVGNWLKHSTKPGRDPSWLLKVFGHVFKLDPEQYRDSVRGLVNPLFGLLALTIGLIVFIYLGVG